MNFPDSTLVFPSVSFHNILNSFIHSFIHLPPMLYNPRKGQQCSMMLQDSVRIWKSNYLYNQPLLHVMLDTSYPAFTGSS